MTTRGTDASDWRAFFAEHKLRIAAPGVPALEQIRALSGLQFLRGIIDGSLPSVPISTTLDFHLIEADEGRAVFMGTPSRAHYNPLGTVHGGWHATLLDSAMACAVQTLLAPGQGYTTLEIKINCVRALTDATGPVRAEGKIISSGRRSATAQGRLVDAAGKLYWHGTTTCILLDAGFG